MDPHATTHDLIDAMARNDREAVDELLQSLQEWNRKGGFLPKYGRLTGKKWSPFIVTRKPAPMLGVFDK